MTTAMSMMPIAFSPPNADCIVQSYLDILIAYDSAQHGITRSCLELIAAYSAQHTCSPAPAADSAFARCTKCYETFDAFDLVITGDAVTNHTQILCPDCLVPPDWLKEYLARSLA